MGLGEVKDDAGVGVCDSTGDELFVPLPPPILHPPPPMGVLNKDGCIWFPNNHGPPKLDELLGAVEVFDVASPRLLVGPPEAFPIPEEDRASETPSSMNLQ